MTTLNDVVSAYVYCAGCGERVDIPDELAGDFHGNMTNPMDPYYCDACEWNEEWNEEYYGMFPREKKYPPIIPEELTECLKKAPGMIDKCAGLQQTLDMALIALRIAKKEFDTYTDADPSEERKQR